MRTLKQLAGYLSALALAAVLIAATQSANAGIANTKHNLSSGNLAIGATTGTRTIGPSTGVFTTGTDEICVFCHSPHGAGNPDVPVPLWNKGTPPGTISGYTQMYMNAVPANAQAPSDLRGHMSLACLSCHDGTQAMDNMINGPGGGHYLAGGASQGYVWSKHNDAASAAAGGGVLGIVGDGTGGTVAGALAPGANSQGTGGMGACDPNFPPPGGCTSGAIDFTTNMPYNHPVGMAYGGGGCTPNLGSSQEGHCNATSVFASPSSGLRGRFEVGPGAPGSSSNFRLYGTDINTATVECGSCHDPHSEDHPSFLRAPLVCNTCHFQ